MRKLKAVCGKGNELREWVANAKGAHHLLVRQCVIVHQYVSVCMWVCAFVYVRVCARAYVCFCARTRLCMWCVCTRMCVYMVCVCVCVCEGLNHICIVLAGRSPHIRSHTVCIYGSGQPYVCVCCMCAHTYNIQHTHLNVQRAVSSLSLLCDPCLETLLRVRASVKQVCVCVLLCILEQLLRFWGVLSCI